MMITILLKALIILFAFDVLILVIILLLIKFVPKESRFGKWLKRNLIEEVSDDLDI